MMLFLACLGCSILHGPAPTKLQNPSGCHGRCSVISCILISPNCRKCSINKCISSWRKSFPLSLYVRHLKKGYAWTCDTERQKHIFQTEEINNPSAVLSVRGMSDGVVPKCFHTSEQHDEWLDMNIHCFCASVDDLFNVQTSQWARRFRLRKSSQSLLSFPFVLLCYVFFNFLFFL